MWVHSSGRGGMMRHDKKDVGFRFLTDKNFFCELQESSLKSVATCDARRPVLHITLFYEPRCFIQGVACSHGQQPK